MKCLNVFLLTQKYFPDHVNDSFKDGEGIPSVLLLFVTKCIFLHRIQYHASRFEHLNIHCILGEAPFMVLRRYIMLINPLILQRRPILHIFYLQKSPMLENSICHCWWL